MKTFESTDLQAEPTLRTPHHQAARIVVAILPPVKRRAYAPVYGRIA
jgi:hypothetical protein